MKKIIFMLSVVGLAAVACDKVEAVKGDDGLKYEIPNFEVPDNPNGPKTPENIVLTKVQEQLVVKNVEFSFNMLKNAGLQLESDNVVLSPLSASIALSMLANGAAEETRQEIVDGLGFTGVDMTMVNEYNRLLLNALPDLDNLGIMSIANSLWLNSGYKSSGFEVYESYKNELTSNYDAMVLAYDFAEGPGNINKWASDMTNGLIKDILKELNPDSQMALANALYFRGKWEDEFRKNNTRKEKFTNMNGISVDVEMMKNNIYAKYVSGEKYAIAELPYGNGAFCFQVILPCENATLDECINGLSGEEWMNSQNEMTSRALEIQLPKFRIEMNNSIMGILNSMGIKTLFSPKYADFSNMSKDDSYVTDIQQATYFSVDEEGSEAAAVTIIGADVDAGEGNQNPEYIPFHVTRPFLFVLKETSTNSILFIGKVSKL